MAAADEERVHRISKERLKYVTRNEPDMPKINAVCKAIARECISVRIRVTVRDNGTTEFHVSGATERWRDLALKLIHERLKGRPAPEPPIAIVPLTAGNVMEHNNNLTETRQFACGPCTRSWWRKVFGYKPVSRCSRCHVRYDPVPQAREFGYGRYTCTGCGHVFYGRAQAGVPAPCFRCGTMCMPENIGPYKEERGPRIGRYRHSCEACDYGRIVPCPSYQFPVVSHPHDSTGSTVSTFLTQLSRLNIEED